MEEENLEPMNDTLLEMGDTQGTEEPADTVLDTVGYFSAEDPGDADEGEVAAANPKDVSELIALKNKSVSDARSLFQGLRAGKKFNRRDVVKILTGMFRVSELQDTVLDLVMNDLMMVDQRFNTLEQQIFQTIQQVSTFSTTLLDKEILTKEDIKETWDKKVKPELEAKLKAAQEQAKKQETPASGLVAPNGVPVEQVV